MRKKTVIAIALLVFTAAVARGELKDTEGKLAGADANTWVFARMEIVMGGGARCKGGETWRFNRNHDVQIKRCESERILVSNEKWSVKQENSLDTVLTIGVSRYYVTFRDSSGAHYMLLRTVVNTKSEERVDKEFRLDAE
jgi:hypothetical protein